MIAASLSGRHGVVMVSCHVVIQDPNKCAGVCGSGGFGPRGAGSMVGIGIGPAIITFGVTGVGIDLGIDREMT
eukprot:CAMPEP_0201952922 /NCGR_PEP_ID=MMETSP0904-20121228/1505_1 /ASSEMBLY_ACC=CAM_ASM_000553 /TAXON_ID=420261 /ORGANISM="Thalassiosira antarctica, Strain CCMP982" /LENGTH=72 /DNA_ID=CAMNT_0048496719 /DNA_START=215 /DNA_END=433 /DNA_ORIENTATION=-